MAAYTRNERRGPRRSRPSDRQTNACSSEFIFKDLKEKVTTLSVDATESSASDVVRLRHVTPVASYSWIDAPVPTIAVPGSPRIWSEAQAPVTQVPLDAGTNFVHHDASKMGNHSPMLPLFAAIDAMHDDFPYAELDLVTDRNGLRKLLRYVDRVHPEDGWRIDVDVVGKTCLFTRREENAVTEGQATGYGNEYLRAATGLARGLDRMLDHHRIVTYKFGSLKVLLGFTVDACVERKRDDADDLLASLSSLNIRGGKVAKTAEQSKPGSEMGLVIRRTPPSHSLVPQSDLIEVKTRSTYREVNWTEIYPQVYLSQTPWLYMAKHTKGVFQPVEKIALTGEEMQPYAMMMEKSMGKLKQLLKAILKAVREQGEGVPLSLVHQGGALSLWRRNEGSGKPLGEDIASKFRRNRKAVH